jgi:hypothetical protein
MNHSRIFFLAFLVAVAGAPTIVGAQDSVEALLQERGVSLVSRESSGGRTLYTLSDKDHGRFTIETVGLVSDSTVRSALLLLENVDGWKSMSPGLPAFQTDGETVRMRIVPDRFVASGRDLRPFVPSGLSFSAQGEQVDYDFRVKSGSYFLRVQGRFQGEAAFLERVLRAINDPALYARDFDTDYQTRRLGELLELVMELEESAIRKSSAMDKAVRDLETRLAIAESKAGQSEKRIEANLLSQQAGDAAILEAVTQSEAGLRAEFATAEGGIRTELARGAAEFKAYQASRAAAEADMIAARKATEAAVMAALSKGLFGAPKPVEAAAVERIASLKTANQALTPKELLSALKADGIVVTDKQIKAVLAVLFNEY